MKYVTRMIAGILAMIMIFALATTAFAANTHTQYQISVPSGENADTHSYDIYQIFTGEYYNEKLSDVKWGRNGTGTENQLVDDTVLQALTAVSGTDRQILDVIEQYVNFSTTPIATVTSSSPVSVDAGYYLLKDSTAAADGDVNTLFLAVVVNDVTIARKGGTVSFNKVINEGGGVDANNAAIGDIIPFKMTATLPENYGSFQHYYMSFEDSLCQGMTLVTSSIVVKVDDHTISNYYIYGDQNDFSVVINDLKAAYSSAAFSSVITVTYDAILNPEAATYPASNENTAKLIYSNDPNVKTDPTPATPGTPGTPAAPTGNNPDKPVNPNKPDPKSDVPNTPYPTGETAEVTTNTYTTGLWIKKVNAKGDLLTGAEFELRAADGYVTNNILVNGYGFEADATNGEYYLRKDGSYTKTEPNESNSNLYVNNQKYTKVEYNNDKVFDTKKSGVVAKGFVSDEEGVLNGVVLFSGLEAGKYILTETTTPQGYNTVPPITIDITWTKDQGFVVKAPYAATAGNAEGKLSLNENEKQFELTVVNKAGVKLPSTGGVGTTMFYALGSIMVLGAGVLLITKKRMSR